MLSANSLWNIANFRSGLVKALRDEGYEVTVAAPAVNGEATCPAEVGGYRPLRIASDGTNPLQDASLLWSYLRLFRRERPLAYLSFTAKPNIYGAMAAGLLGVPAIPNVSGLGTAFIRQGALQLLISRLYRLAFRRAPVVFFQNGEDRDLFLGLKLVQPQQARLLPGSGVDLTRFQPPAEPAGPADATGLTFLYVGRLLGDKGIRELVEAARMVKQVHAGTRFQLLGFVGAANRTAITQEELAAWENEGVVEYLGSAEDVRLYLAAADAVVLPSYREGLPRSLLEAAAMARPLIAADVPGCREVVVPGSNGLLCQVRSAASLAEALLQFIGLPDAERRRMGAASRRMVEERFSEQKVIAAYLTALRDVVSRRHEPGGAFR